jgi:hypothetical protein
MTSWDFMPGVPAAGHVTSGGHWHPGAKDNCTKCVVATVVDEATCCKRVAPNHPANHNHAIRTSGRCECACHGTRAARR